MSAARNRIPRRYSILILLIVSITLLLFYVNHHTPTNLNSQLGSLDALTRSLCELHPSVDRSCCLTKHSAKSWFDCKQSTEMRSSKISSETESTLSMRYQDWSDKKVPEYKIPNYYYRTPPTNSNETRVCPVNAEAREVGYHLLRYWSEFAKKHKIVWWITMGTLLGAIRDQDYIPYDTDVDVTVLSDYDDLIKSLSRTRGTLQPQDMNLITRIGAACDYDDGKRYNCEGHGVWRQVDRCAICYPLGRLIYGKVGYIDIYSVRIRNPLDHAAREVSGIAVEYPPLNKNTNYPPPFPLKHIFPLSECHFLDLIVPCPRNPHAVLSEFYGDSYMQPMKQCNLRDGTWMKN